MYHTLQTSVLAGGSQLLTINVPGASSVFIGSGVRSGYRFAPAELYELPHLLEHLAFEGNVHYPNSLDFNRAIERRGADSNATTSIDENLYHFAGGISELFDLLPLAAYQLFEPSLADAAISYEREAVINELSAYLDDDDYRCEYLNEQLVTPSLRPAIEKRLAITRRLNRANLAGFHRTYYGTRNVWIVIAGDIPPKRRQRILMTLEKLLSAYPKGRKHTYHPVGLSKYERKIKTIDSSSPSQSQFLLRFVKPGRDVSAVSPLRILSALCDGGASALLDSKVRKSGLAYGIDTGRSTSIDYTDFECSAQTLPQKLLPLFTLVVSEIAALRLGGFSDDELARAKQYVAGGLERLYETPTDYAEWYGPDFVMGRALTSPDQRRLEILDVSRADVLEAAQRYLNSKNWVLTLAGRGLEQEKVKYRQVLDSCLPGTTARRI